MQQPQPRPLGQQDFWFAAGAVVLSFLVVLLRAVPWHYYITVPAASLVAGLGISSVLTDWNEER